jgi:sigma-B regulation protein RsbU (phosphoserine phosphatase)
MPYRILVVDDEPDWEELIKQIFEKQTQNKEWELLFARNGREALQKVKETPDLEVILLDIHMPEMDGLTFLKNLNKTECSTIKVIIVTAYGDMGNIRKAMNEGAFDFLTKPIDFKDLEFTVNKAIKESLSIKKAMDDHNQLIAHNRELEIAAGIQKSMLPRELPRSLPQNGFEIYPEMIPAKRVGGDFYDFFFLDADKCRLALVIGDVSGKGISAALYMARFSTLFKETARRVIHPGECLRLLHRLILTEKGEESNLSVTVFYGIFDIKKKDIQYGCAGNPTPYMLGNSGEVTLLGEKGGYPLGLSLNPAEDTEYEVEKIQLKKGDALLICTDGVTEAENSEGRQFKEEKGIADYLEKNHKMPLEDMVAGLIREIQTFTGNAPPADDITLLALRCK